jgi:hemerythrin-like domain-containing protein
MLPIGTMMWEHRLIERLIGRIRNEIRRIDEEAKSDPVFIEKVTDFFRTYADRCHHGKEEDILFRELEKKDLAPEHKKMMQRLVEDHTIGRNLVKRLDEARTSYLSGDEESLSEIRNVLSELESFYPEHIRKEDKEFFYPCMEYFSDQEQREMLNEFNDFDRKMIHEKYEAVVNRLEEEEQQEPSPNLRESWTPVGGR